MFCQGQKIHGQFLTTISNPANRLVFSFTLRYQECIYGEAYVFFTRGSKVLRNVHGIKRREREATTREPTHSSRPRGDPQCFLAHLAVKSQFTATARTVRAEAYTRKHTLVRTRINQFRVRHSHHVSRKNKLNF